MEKISEVLLRISRVAWWLNPAMRFVCRAEAAGVISIGTAGRWKRWICFRGLSFQVEREGGR
jgi:hypothetical protein